MSTIQPRVFLPELPNKEVGDAIKVLSSAFLDYPEFCQAWSEQIANSINLSLLVEVSDTADFNVYDTEQRHKLSEQTARCLMGKHFGLPSPIASRLNYVPGAMRELTLAINEKPDSGYAISWHCNIAVSIMDEITNAIASNQLTVTQQENNTVHTVANASAALFMERCFGAKDYMPEDVRNTVNMEEIPDISTEIDAEVIDLGTVNIVTPRPCEIAPNVIVCVLLNASTNHRTMVQKAVYSPTADWRDAFMAFCESHSAACEESGAAFLMDSDYATWAPLLPIDLETANTCVFPTHGMEVVVTYL
jgi:hypothetical protein